MRKAWLAAGGTVVALLVGELVCRAVTENPFTGPGENRDSWRVVGLVSDPELGYSFQPGYEGRMTLAGEYDLPFRINAQGLRDDHEFATEHAGTARILLVGDSFAFGVGVELQDTLGEQLERALDGPVEVVTAGVPGYGLDSYALLLERWIPRLHPDLVMVALFPGNDLLDYELKASDPRLVIDGMLVDRRLAWSWKLRRISTLAHLALDRFNPYSRNEQYRPDKPTPADLDRIVRSAQPWIARIAAAGQPPGPPVVIALCHGAKSVRSWRAGDIAAHVPPCNEVLAECARLGLEVLDPKPAWMAPELPVAQLFFARDAHYTPAGNRFVARWLAARLLEIHAAELAPAASR